MSVRASCPACAAPVTFQVGTSLVTVCEYCKSVIGRSDRGLESLGKVADLVETASPLEVGLKGRFQDVPFFLSGRTQYQHPAGGVWDEWYVAFQDGRWGWLAEAQGRFYLTFESSGAEQLPASYDSLELGQRIKLADGQVFLVAEKNRGTVISARGEIPYRVVPGEEIPFADLSGPSGEFGTLDYSGDKPILYLGRQVTLDELHIPPGSRRSYPGQEPRLQAVQLNCPQCGAALELRAPDQSERVGCPSCGALSDVREGQLKLLKSLDPPPVKPLLPLGSVGKYQGIDWTVIGFMQRYVRIEGENYFWEEYLLYQPRLGFRWLTRSDEHWNWVEPLPPASVRTEGNTAYYADRYYRLFQQAKAKVSFVIGEFYWKVQEGETVLSRDYVNAPGMLSEEITKENGQGEINWSFASYLPASEIEQMFGLQVSLPRPSTIGPNQPFPYSGIYSSALYLLAAALLLGMGFWLLSPNRTIYSATVQLPALPEGQRVHKIIVEEPLEVRGRQNLRIAMLPAADSGWIHLEGSLVSRNSSPVPGGVSTSTGFIRRSFAFLATAGQQSYVYLSAVPAGKYTLQYDLAPRIPTASTSATVQIRQGVAHPFLLVITLVFLGGVPLAVAFYQVWFEAQRWQDSNVT